MLRNEYPRPQFKRTNYQILNGNWGFDFDDKNEFLKKHKPQYKELSKSIEVPFAFQSKLSGINDLGLHEVVWYEKKFDLSADLIGQDVILHFNAVDNEAMVFLNGVYIGEHKGGYTHFSFDVTKAIKKKDNVLVVRVEDRYDPMIPRGKQYWEKEPSRCWYNANTGIWQSVWLEGFKGDYLEKTLITPDIDENKVTFDIETAKGVATDITIEISYKEQLVKKVTTSLDKATTNAIVKLKEADSIDEIHYWRLEDPNLYDVRLTLLKDGVVLDTVDTYFGFRKIHVDEHGNIFLNHQKLYQRLILDQGYFEEGDLTPASVEDLKNDILIAKAMGFNGARKHQKIEDPYFYYYADKLGFLVWAELPSAYYFHYNEVKMISEMAQDVVKQLYNHPSIITWVPFNESWGIRKALYDVKQQNFIRSMYYLIKTIDTSRLVDGNDGWEQVEETDFIAIHDYEPTGDEFPNKYQTENLNYVQPMGRRLMAYGQCSKGKPVILTEYGGLSEARDVKEQFFGYHVASDKEILIKDLAHLQANVAKCKLNGFCYTQLTDVKQETNGLLYANHQPKFDVETIRKIMLGIYEG